MQGYKLSLRDPVAETLRGTRSFTLRRQVRENGASPFSATFGSIPSPINLSPKTPLGALAETLRATRSFTLRRQGRESGATSFSATFGSIPSPINLSPNPLVGPLAEMLRGTHS